MESVKQTIKRVTGKALVQTGIWEGSLRRWARRGEAIILTYHRVIEKWDRALDYSQPGMVVTSDTFERQLHFLKQNFDIVPLSSLVNSLSTLNSQLSNLNRPLCVITFDDGWRDNYEIAFPILRQHGLPATIFLTTDFIGANRAFWHTELLYLVMHGDLSRFRLLEYVLQAYPSPVRHRWRQVRGSAQTPSAHELDPLVEAVKATCGEDEIHNLIRDVRYALAASGPLLSQDRFFLDWDQVREMASARIEFGSHGCSHRILTRLRAEEAQGELVRSKAEIEGRIGQEVRDFAFPEESANRELINLADKAGYRVVCVKGLTYGDERSGTLLVQRIGMHEGISRGRDGSFSEPALLLWLFRGPKRGPRQSPVDVDER